MSGEGETGLSRFQIEAARLFFSLPESAGFLLAGGGALIVQGLVARQTEDLDFFTQRGGGDVDAAASAVEAAASDRGWRTEVIRSGTEFRRIKLTRPAGQPGDDGEEVVYIDLAIDTPPAGTPTVTIAGPALPPRELAIRKTLALFSRAEPRDFTDVHAIHQHFDRSEVLAAAAAADPGFELSVFVQMLRSHQRLRDEDFPPASVDITDLRVYFDTWAEDLDD
ncbi:MAG: nucleotidyl transferase AbiEii/AbiGii toxin family protein [Nocardioides sp.]